jgi:hypothetical protein
MLDYLIKLADSFLHILSKSIKRCLWFVYKEIDTNENFNFPTIDVVIPLIAKDLKIVGDCISSLHKFSLNPIRNIYIISPRDESIIDFAIKNQLIYIFEDEICRMSSPEIISYLKSKLMTGWLKQQLIKLNANLIPDILENFLLFDSDTMLCKKQFFLNTEFSVLKFSDEFHLQYKLANNYLLKDFSFIPLSYISHHQIINVRHLVDLKRKVESYSNKSFNQTFLDAFLKFKNVSEYELYAQYVLTYHPECYKTQYWFNKNYKENKYLSTDKKIVSSKAHSLSFHNYNYS